MDYTLKELLDVPRLRELLDALDEIHSMPSGIIDTEGNVLIATAWQDICTKFHRVNPDTEKRCIESDTHIRAGLDNNMPHIIYRCPMGLVDAATPIIINGKHLGNVFTGQLFLEPPDESYFIEQARQFGFDESDYLEAMRKVPLFSEERLHKNLSFIHGLAQMLAEHGLQHKRQHEAEKAQKEAAEEWRKTFDTVPDPVAIIAPDYSVVKANLAFAELVGKNNKNLVGMKCCSLVHGLNSPIPGCPLSNTLKEQKKNLAELYEPHLDKHLRISATPLFADDGTLAGAVHAIHDITALKQAEEEKLALQQQLQQTQKLESLSVLAGGIAHDFNNILAIILGYCYIVKMDYETAEHHIPEIEKSVERAAGLCRQMLTYAGKAPLDQEQIEMEALVDEMLNMLKSPIPRNLVIKPDFSSNIPLIKGDANQIRQIVMSLLSNASEAIGDEMGEIHVSLSKSVVRTDKSDKDHLGKIITPGCYVCLEVTDNGCGMDDETRRRIFEPFYTTKFTGRGLGLSAVLGIIKAHKGALQLFSQPGTGTTFKVYLPVLSSDSIGDEAIRQLLSEEWQGGGTVLLVEDEEQILFIAKTMLKALGFTVIEASNGRDALELYQKNAADITLVVTDMGMPLMDGYELFCELKKRNPQLPIIISSGFGYSAVTSRIPREDIAGLLSKPYGFDQFREVLKSVVEGSAT
ncbi:MAG: PocR ligand-binding domain-containing protein [Desulfuromonadaceae bacterium]|nr:PocR ligand-binding domain-containing protein [Desulfuromonadaceae bacterium]